MIIFDMIKKLQVSGYWLQVAQPVTSNQQPVTLAQNNKLVKR
jgi:hypothetical protein